MALPQLAVLGVVTVALWLFYWRSEPTRYEVPPPLRPRNRRTFALAGVCTAMFIVGILAGVSIAVAAVVTAALLTLGFVRWDRSSLTWNLISWRLLVFVTGLFLVVDTIGRHGLSSLVSSLIGTDPGGAGIVRAAATGAGLSNAVNNLPAYVAGEAVIPVANHHQLIGLLIGTNVGPVIVPWASLATLIWAEHCRHAGVTINWRRFMVTGALMAAGALTAAVAVLIAMPLHDHGGSISLPFLDTSGLVQAARLKQQGRRFPLFIFEILTSTRRLRVSGFLVAFTQRTHSQRAIGVMSFHRSWIF
jgi:arsenical pump membrane protein